MSYQEVFEHKAVAISTSESPDMAALGLSEEHLRDAMTEIARHLLALGARLVYGGDLRHHGFTELLFELVARHTRDAEQADGHSSATNFLAWPVHIVKTSAEIAEWAEDLAGSAELVCLDLKGSKLGWPQRRRTKTRQPTDVEWSTGLTSMRRAMLAESNARIILGGRVDKFKGAIPGLAEEALLSLEARQPLYVMGGFGGCGRDIAETIGLVGPWAGSRANWPGRARFSGYSNRDLNNGLGEDENAVLARTPHVDQAVTLIIRGLVNVIAGDPNLRRNARNPSN